MPDITISSILAMIAVNWGVPAVLVFWYAGRVRHPARPRWRAFLMAMAVVAVVPPAWLAALYYYVVIHEGSMVLAALAILALPFVLRALIRGWLRRPPAVRRAPERSPRPGRGMGRRRDPCCPTGRPGPPVHRAGCLTRREVRSRG